MLKSELHYLMLRCFHHSNRYIVSKTAELGLLPGQPKILECLHDQDGLSPVEISRRCVLDKSTVTSLLYKMEQHQLIMKKSHPADRRSVNIYLTSQGREKASEVRKICMAADDLALKAFSKQEKEQIISMLQNVTANFENHQTLKEDDHE